MFLYFSPAEHSDRKSPAKNAVKSKDKSANGESSEKKRKETPQNPKKIASSATPSKSPKGSVSSGKGNAKKLESEDSMDISEEEAQPASRGRQQPVKSVPESEHESDDDAPVAVSFSTGREQAEKKRKQEIEAARRFVLGRRHLCQLSVMSIRLLDLNRF